MGQVGVCIVKPAIPLSQPCGLTNRIRALIEVA